MDKNNHKDDKGRYYYLTSNLNLYFKNISEYLETFMCLTLGLQFISVDDLMNFINIVDILIRCGMYCI